jgi:GTP-binding protein HflX
VQVLDTLFCKLVKPFPRYFIGSGKAEELHQHVLAHQAEVVIFNCELSPAQARNLEKLFQCRVLDRTELILDIFAKRAQTFEGRLQVELAQLQHLRSRLVHGWTHLERQKGGIGLRGPGETQLETDRRLVALRIKTIKNRLEKVLKQRAQRRRAREKSAIPTVSLVGYTNAGKSMLFNQLTQASVYTADQLFATLDPSLRRMELSQIGPILLADTVGFIRHLPHELVAAFRATLEETQQANLLLHVIDVCDSSAKETIKSVESVLQEIDAAQIPCLQVYNKIDQNKNFEARLDRGSLGVPKKVWLSAKTGEGIELLKQALIELLSDQVIRCRLILEPQQGKLHARLHALGVIQKELVDEEGRWLLDVQMQKADFDKIKHELFHDLIFF